MTDFFREVDEDLRRERYARLWDRYGLYAIGIVVAIALLAGGIVVWNNYRDNSLKSASEGFEALEADTQDLAPADAAPLWAEFADETGERGYQNLARFRQAAALEKAGKPNEAVNVLEGLAGSAGNETLQGLAKLKAGMILVDSVSYDDLANRLAGMDTAQSPWRNQVRELLAVSALSEERYQDAADHLRPITADPDASGGVRSRAHVLYAMVSPHLSQDDQTATQDETAQAAEPAAAPTSTQSE